MKIIKAAELQGMINRDEKFTMINVLDREKFNEAYIPH